LREQILSGELAPGTRLAGESPLARELAVSRPTIRGALLQLQREGLVVTRQGVGSFVASRRISQTMAHLETLDATLAEQGLNSSTRVIEFLFTAPTTRVRSMLRLEADAQVLQISRAHMIDDVPIAHVRMCLPGAIGVNFSRNDMEHHPLYELLPSRLGVRIGQATQTVRAESASPAIALALDIGERMPVLACERVTYSAELEPVIYALFHYRADRFEFRANLSAHESRVSWHLPGLAPQAPEVEAPHESEAETVGGVYAG
jgi:GntR family transcriptional regulator